MDRPFTDRYDAGRRLAAELTRYAGRDDVVVLALPRGGVPVGYEVAQALDVPLEPFLVRKLGVPWQEELAMGAIASGGVWVLNQEVLRQLSLSEEDIEAVAARERRELERRERLYRHDRPFPDLHGRTVILVDDGLATGSTMRAAVEAAREAGTSKVVVAVPVAPPEVCEAFHDLADETVCAVTPERFYAVGVWYEDFRQTTDEEVVELLRRAETAEPRHV
jgi:predicted phosphoribosyltransferase